MADQIQSPVFILTDQYLADSIVTTDPWKITCVSREYKTYGAEYQRYALATPVSPITYPGLSESLVQADSDEHDEFGQITEDLRLRVRMQDKRMAKQNQISFRMPSLSGDEQSSTVIISWGSNKLIVAEAVQELNKQGVSCQSVHFSQVYPLDQKVIDTFSGKTCVVVENNFTGQFSEVLHKYNLPIQHRILKYDGACFTVQEIISKIKEIV
jgi:2-oxoglutarate ferredoxin oxidoreductase subunit alpha